ncbi:MAG: dipeptidase [Candidatus Marinimicrobia bacterium]|jgi:membrane dipeptidase|nr:dipeptidase [Candidatus Neomarinimicrobiota bacterium]|tara:strand:- start:9665 stop:10864 length:1200 start_codon:yes stop_codon:yes gene_type:complete
MRLIKQVFLLTIGILIGGCSNDATLRKQAYELAHKFIITDGHIDVPWRLNDGYEDLSVRTEGGDFDYVRAKEGGLDAPFMSIYVPSSYQETGGAKEKADSLINLVHRIADDHPDKFEVAFSVADVNRIFADGKIALPMGMENGAPILDDLNNVQYFHDRGIRYITLTHAKDNLICDSSYDTTNTWDGLSPFGRKVVKEMNRVGIMVDISHVTDNVINQVLDMTDVPVIASHSSCRHFTPGFERNMGDEEIKRLKENGGVIQINFGSSFVTKESQEKEEQNRQIIMAYAKENSLNRGDDKLKSYWEKVSKENPIYADITDVVNHIDRVVELTGIDHVGIGSDYDGVGDSLPYGLKDVSSYPNLIFHLLKRGYSEEDIEKICYKNVWRVWSTVEKAAAQAG